MNKPTRVADSLTAETQRLRDAGVLPAGPLPPVPASRTIRITDGLGDPDCPHCHGLGYVRDEVALGGRNDTRAPAEYGKVHPCACSEARIKIAQTAVLRGQTGMDDVDLGLSWTGLYETPGTGAAIAAVRHTLGRAWGWVYLWGEPGPGKSMLLKTAVAETVRSGVGAVFVTWPDLLNHMRRGFKDGDYDERVEAWRSVPVLAVDELGRAKESEWVSEAEVLIFNHRHESALRHQTITLLAGNFAPDSERIDDWFYDRLRDGRYQIVHVSGPSLRPAMRED